MSFHQLSTHMELSPYLILQIDAVLADNAGTFYLNLQEHIIAESLIGTEVNRSNNTLSSINRDRFQKEKSALVPMCARTFRGRIQHNLLRRSIEGDVEPSGHSVQHRYRSGQDGQITDNIKLFIQRAYMS